MENGCIKLLKGSNQLGRIDHVSIGDQQASERVSAAAAAMLLSYHNKLCTCVVIFVQGADPERVALAE